MANSGLSSSLLALVAMVAIMAALPWLLKRWQQRNNQLRGVVGVSSQVLSSVVVGQNQRVVTVEVGQGSQKVCLVLGVSPQAISCLHVLGQPQPTVGGGFGAAMAEAQSAGPQA